MEKKIKMSGIISLFGTIVLAVVIAQMQDIPFSVDLIGPLIYWGVVFSIVMMTLVYTLGTQECHFVAWIFIIIIIAMIVKGLIFTPKPITFYSYCRNYSEEKTEYINKNGIEFIKYEGTVDEIKMTVVDGQSRYCITIRGNEKQTFVVNISLSADLPFIKSGDKIEVAYGKSKDKDILIHADAFELK